MKQRDYLKCIIVLLSLTIAAGTGIVAVRYLRELNIVCSYLSEPSALTLNQAKSRGWEGELMDSSKTAAESQLISGTVKAGGLIAGLQLRVCGMDEEAMNKTLAEPHGTGVGQERYFYEGRWMTIDTFSEQARADGGEGVVCVVAHIEGQMPCRGVEGGCVLHFYVRPKDTDMDVLRQLVEYEELVNLDTAADFETILDGGGNCGINAALFATQWPKARIISVEPGQASYDLLRMNTQQFPNVVPVHAGLWNKESRLVLFGPDHFAWGLQVTEANGSWTPDNVLATLDGVSIPYLLRLAGLDHFDFMKLDIEGSEKEVFEKVPGNDLSFLDKVKVAAIELHDRYRVGCTDAVNQAFSAHFMPSYSKEYAIFTRYN